jgi:hypothetical protein
MKKYITFSLLIYIVLLFLPILVSAAIEHPFGGMGSNPNPCTYTKTIFVWGLGIVGALAVASIAYGGFRYMVGDVQNGKDIIYSALLGLLLLMATWLILYTINPDLATLQCNATTSTDPGTPTAQQQAQDFSEAGVDNTAQNQDLLSQKALDQDNPPATTNCPINQNATNAVNNATNLNGVDKARVIAIIQAESSGNTNATHQDVDGKSSYGLMQIRVGTARQLDPSGTSGLTDAQVGQKLMSDQNYNINLGTKYYSDLVTRYNGDTTKAHAAYNGGPMANNPSANCPGQARWQCVWDSNGCYGTTNTNCTPNTGYAPTRTYISNINCYVSKA